MTSGTCISITRDPATKLIQNSLFVPCIQSLIIFKDTGDMRNPGRCYLDLFEWLRLTRQAVRLLLFPFRIDGSVLEISDVVAHIWAEISEIQNHLSRILILCSVFNNFVVVTLSIRIFKSRELNEPLSILSIIFAWDLQYYLKKSKV